MLPGNKVRVPVPFNPDEAWGTERVHHVNGTVSGVRVRVTFARDDAWWVFSLGPGLARQGPTGDEVVVVISPERVKERLRP